MLVEDAFIGDGACVWGVGVGEDVPGGCVDEVEGFVVQGPADAIWDRELRFQGRPG